MGEATSNNTRRRVFVVLAYIFSLGCLIWTLRGARLGELKDDIANMNWAWVALGVVTDILVYFFHGWRWSLLLRPVAPVGFWQAVRAIYVGLFVNEVLPFRAGEVIRCYLLGRWTHLPVSVSLASALIERIFDGFWLVTCMLLTLRFVQFPSGLRYLVDGSYLLGVLVLAAAALLGLAMFRRHQTREVLSPHTWQRHLRVLIDDLHLIGHSRYLYFSALASVPYLLMQVVPVYAVLRGYGFDLSLGAAFVLMVMLRLSTVVPQAPGNLGLYQLVTMVTLQNVFNVVAPEAKRFSLVLWGVVTLPLLVGGFVALAITGAKIGQLRREAEVSAGKREPASTHDRIS